MGWDQVILLVVVGLFALVKWLMENSGDAVTPPGQRPGDAHESDEPQESEGTPLSGVPEESYEERMRRLREALGLPEDEIMPPRRKTPMELPGTSAMPMPRPLPPPAIQRDDERKRFQPKSVRRPLAVPSFPASPHEGPSLAPPQLPKTTSVQTTAPSMEVLAIPGLADVAGEGTRQQAERFERTHAGTSKSLPAGVPAKPDWPGAPLRVQLRNPEAVRKAVMMREILGAPKSLQ